MAKTYEPIASVPLTGASSYDFTSIPGTFTDLVIVMQGQCSSTGTVAIRFNADTGSNYSDTYVYGTGSSAASSRDSSITQARLGRSAVGSGSTQFTLTATVMSYANTNVYKTFLASTADPGAVAERLVGLWRSTSAITSVTVKSAGAETFTNGSISLYGIKAA